VEQHHYECKLASKREQDSPMIEIVETDEKHDEDNGKDRDNRTGDQSVLDEAVLDAGLHSRKLKHKPLEQAEKTLCRS